MLNHRLLTAQPDPLPTHPRSYVPALQDKPGELLALKHASDAAWASMTPLVHLVGPPRNAKRHFRAPNLESKVQQVAEAVGDHPIYLALQRLPPTTLLDDVRGGQRPALEIAYDAADRAGLNFIPVANAGDGSRLRALAADAAAATGHGLALRIHPLGGVTQPGTTFAQTLLRLAADAELASSEIDLLLDLGWLDPDVRLSAQTIARFVAEAATAAEWRSLVLLGTSMPKSMPAAGIGEDSTGTIPRREWILWNELHANPAGRLPAFGDYAVQHPHPPPRSGKAPLFANVRYASGAHFVVERGRDVRHHGYGQYRELCLHLADGDEFAGGDFSWGDGEIERCADGGEVPRSQSTWRAIGTSHHFELVRKQLDQAAA